MKDQATIRMLQQQISELQKQMKVVQNAPALRNASIEDTSIPVLDADGRITSVIGRQEDGSSGVSVRRSPFQPMPSKPIVGVGSRPGTALVKWDGGTHFPTDTVPQIHGRVEVWAYLLGDGEEPFTAPNPGAERLGTIRDRTGGEVGIPVPAGGTWAVWLRMVGQDGETVSDWSPAETFEVVPLFDVDDFEQRLRAFANGEELDDAAYENLMARTGEFLIVRTDQLEANFFNGLVMTAPVVQSHDAPEEGWKLRYGTGYQAWDTSGNETVRIDGVENFIRGSIHAGIADEAEIHLDYGEMTLSTGEDEDGEPEVITTYHTPYIEFRDGSKHTIRPSITLGTDGHLVIRPGSLPDTPSYRAPLNIAGDLRVNQVNARNRITSPSGLRLGSATTNQPGGLDYSGLRTRLLGRMHDTHGATDQIIYGIGPSAVHDPDQSGRGTVFFDAPCPTGVRVTQAWGHVANTSWGWENHRGVTISTARRDASSFRYTRQPARNNIGPVESWVYFTAYWI